jgi:hypothetical protein
MMRPSVHVSIIAATIFVVSCSSAGAATPAASVGAAASPGPSAAAGSDAAVPGEGFAGATLVDVAAFANGFVTVGSAPIVDGRQFGGIWTSADGVTWTAASPTTLGDAAVQAATAVDDGIVAVGKICSTECYGFYSWRTDAAGTWSGPAAGSSDPATTPVSVAARGPLVVGAGFEFVSGGATNGRILTSPDGEVWTAMPDVEAMHDARLAAIAAGKRFVVVGSVVAASGRTAAAWSSPDASRWTRAADDPTFANATFSSVVTGGPGYLAVGGVGDDGAVWTSTDGQTWARLADQGTFTGSPLVDIATNGTGFIAIGNDAVGGTAWTSSDGATWVPVATIRGSADVKFVSVALGPKSSVIVGRPASPTSSAGLIFQVPSS